MFYNTGVKVGITGNVYTALTWTITYNTYNNPGQQPLLRIDDQTTLFNEAGPVQVTRLIEGSTDFFYGPIPGELMRQAVDVRNYQAVGVDSFPTNLTAAVASLNSSSNQQPLQLLDIYINNVLSSCGPKSDYSQCSFSYSQTLTPVVNAVNPGSLTAGQNLTVSGRWFAGGNVSANHVWLSGVECVVGSATASQLICTSAGDTTAGIHEVRLLWLQSTSKLWLAVILAKTVVIALLTVRVLVCSCCSLLNELLVRDFSGSRLTFSPNFKAD